MGHAGCLTDSDPSRVRRATIAAPGLTIPALLVGERGPRILLLHGSADSESCWRPVMEELGGQFRLVAPSLVGARDGVAPPGPAVTSDRKWLDALLEELKPAAVVGHSYGGLLALRARVGGAPIPRLGLIEPIAFGLLREVGAADGVDELNARFFGALEEGRIEDGLRWLVEYWNGRGSWAALPDTARERLRAGPGHTAAEVLSGREDRTCVAELTDLTQGAALVLAGEHTTAESLRVSAELAAGLGVSRGVIEGAGHQAPRTHGALVAARIRAWLADAGA